MRTKPRASSPKTPNRNAPRDISAKGRYYVERSAVDVYTSDVRLDVASIRLTRAMLRKMLAELTPGRALNTPSRGLRKGK